jgi:hypothetical protein
MKLVSAQWVVTFRIVTAGFELAEIPWAFRMIDDHLLIEIG